MPDESEQYGEEIKNLYRKAGLTPPEGKGIHTMAFHKCVVGYLGKDKNMPYSEAAKRCMGALGPAKAVNPSHRKAESFGEKLGQYKITEDGDFVTIHGVPIFQLGSFESKDGASYDETWFKKAKKTHEDLKSEHGYVPPVFIGHTTGDDGEEKPAVGHFDNLKRKGKVILADLRQISKEVYEQIKKGMWPSRSVEAVNTETDSRLLGLALLGATTPACKFAPMHFDGNPEDIERFEYNETDIQEDAMADEAKIETEKETETVVIGHEKAKEEIVAEVLEIKPEVKLEVKDELLEKLKRNEIDRQNEKIKALEARLASVQSDVDKSKEDGKRAQVDAFIDTQNAKGKLPKSVIQYDGNEKGAALRDLMLKATDEVRSEIMKLLESMPQVAQFKESAKVGDEETKQIPSASLRFQKLVDEYQEKHSDAGVKAAQDAVAIAHPDLMAQIAEEL